MTAGSKNKAVPPSSDGGGKVVQMNSIQAAVPPAMPAALSRAIDRAAGPKAAELRAWQLAMLELAGRHSVSQVGRDGGILLRRGLVGLLQLSLFCAPLAWFLGYFAPAEDMRVSPTTIAPFARLLLLWFQATRDMSTDPNKISKWTAEYVPVSRFQAAGGTTSDAVP